MLFFQIFQGYLVLHQHLKSKQFFDYSENIIHETLACIGTNSSINDNAHYNMETLIGINLKEIDFTKYKHA